MKGRTKKATLPELTPRERQIVELIWAGFQNKAIAERLNLSVKTVEAHRASVMKKWHVGNTAQLLKTALTAGVLKAA